jgi:hypothetical protein
MASARNSGWPAFKEQLAETLNAYIAKRKADVIVVKKAKGEIEAVTKLTSNSQINRELTTLKRMFSLAELTLFE